MKFKEFKKYISFDSIFLIILLVLVLIMVLSIIIMIPIEIITSVGIHRCLTFEDGTEYHVKCDVIYNDENIIFDDGSGMMSIPIKDRGYTVTDCDCENAVSNIEDIKEKENENLH